MRDSLRKHRISIVVIICFVAFVVAITLIRQNSYQKQIDLLSENEVITSAKLFANLESGDTKMMAGLIETLTCSQEFREAFVQQDKDRLYDTCLPIYKNLNEKYGIRDIIFYVDNSTDGLLLKMKKSNKLCKLGDKSPNKLLSTSMFKDAEIYSGKQFSNGVFCLRVVVPFYNNGKIKGYIEMTKEINRFLDLMKLETGYDYGVVFEKKFIKNNDFANKLDGLFTAYSTNNENNPNWTGSFEIPYTPQVLKIEEKGNDLYVKGIFPIYDADWQKVGGVYLIQDITSFKNIAKEWRTVSYAMIILIIIGITLIVIHMERGLWRSEERYYDIFDNSHDLIQSVGCDGTFLYVNKAWLDTLGYEKNDLYRLKYFDIIHPCFLEQAKQYIEQITKGKKLDHFEVALIAKNGDIVEVEGNAICQWEGEEVVSTRYILRDVTDERKLFKQLQHLAYHDTLTDLPGRSLFIERLHSAINQARNKGNLVAVMFLDLDRFKQVNDKMGHSIGDKLLVEVSNRLLTSISECNTLARFGGDEFIILLNTVLTKDEVEATARNIIQCLQKPWAVDNEEFIINVSIGIALFPSNGEDAETLMKNADIAMYNAKNHGGNKFTFFKEN